LKHVGVKGHVVSLLIIQESTSKYCFLSYHSSKVKWSSNWVNDTLTGYLFIFWGFLSHTVYKAEELQSTTLWIENVLNTMVQVEQMESRLKDDILAEAERTGGRMLLHKEEYNPIAGHSDIIGYWEVISAEDVQTPAEVYAGLRAEGYNLDYQRIPLTRERAALTADVDAIHRRLDEYVPLNKSTGSMLQMRTSGCCFWCFL
jgi:hypothetical protein